MARVMANTPALTCPGAEELQLPLPRLQSMRALRIPLRPNARVYFDLSSGSRALPSPPWNLTSCQDVPSSGGVFCGADAQAAADALAEVGLGQFAGDEAEQRRRRVRQVGGDGRRFAALPGGAQGRDLRAEQVERRPHVCQPHAVVRHNAVLPSLSRAKFQPPRDFRHGCEAPSVNLHFP